MFFFDLILKDLENIKFFIEIIDREKEVNWGSN